MAIQLTMEYIFNLIDALKAAGYTKRDIKKFPVYIGNDNELNGIHCAEYGQLIDVANPEDAVFLRLINEDSHNFEIKDKAILIS